MAKNAICAITDCDKPSKTRGYCQAHYLRLLRHGSPLGGGSPRGLSKPCSISGCEAKSYVRGWCVRHYQRWRKHGDPSKVKLEMADKGEPMRFFKETVLPFVGDGCLDWPFSKTPSGYGQLWQNGKIHIVTRLACEAVNGPPPEPNYDAAHSCGKGHLGCCNPKHLSWKTRKENVADMVAHGTARFWGKKMKCR